MEEVPDCQRDDIYKMLVITFCKDSSTRDLTILVKLLFILDASDLNRKNMDQSPFWSTIYIAQRINNIDLLKQYCEKLVERNDNINACHRYWCQVFGTNYSNSSQKPLIENINSISVENLLNQLGVEPTNNGKMFGTSLSKSWEYMSTDVKVIVVKIIKDIAFEYSTSSNSKKLNKPFNGIIKYVLLSGGVLMSFKMLYYIYSETRFNMAGTHMGQVPGVINRYRENIAAFLDSSTVFSLNIILASYLGAKMGFYVVDKLFGSTKNQITEKIFNVSNSYKFFGVAENASNVDVRKAIKKAYLKYHPDKGGRAEDFHKILQHVEAIELDRKTLSGP